MHAPIIRMVSSCIVAVTVFWCSLTESNHVLIFTFVDHTRLYFTLNQSFKWVQVKQYHTPWSPILAHTKVSVYLTGFRDAQLRSVTLRKSISWNLAPEEKIILFPPAWNCPKFHIFTKIVIFQVYLQLFRPTASSL